MAEGTLQRTHHTSCVFAISAYSMTSCAAMLQRDADSGHARQTREQHHASHALTITLTCPRSSAQPSRLVGHRFRDADDETSRQRGAWDVPANYVKVAFNVSSSSDHTERRHATGVRGPRAGVRGPRGATTE